MLLHWFYLKSSWHYKNKLCSLFLNVLEIKESEVLLWKNHLETWQVFGPHLELLLAYTFHASNSECMFCLEK